MSKKLKGKLLLVIALLFLCVVSCFFSLNPFIVKAESSETPIFEVVQNASVRVKTNSSGIRFTARINDAYLEQYPNASFSYRAKINAVGATDDAAQEVAVAQPDENGYIYVSVVYDNLRDDLKTAAYGVELYPEFYLDVTVNGETETVQATGEINRSMRAVAYDRYVNYITEDIEGYEQELLLEYFSIVNQDEVVNYAFSDGKMIFTMAEYPEPADDEIVTAYVGSEKYTAKYDAETKKYTATGVELELNEQTTIAIFGEDNTVYSTQVVRPNELSIATIENLQTATSGYWVLTEDIDMSKYSGEWKPSAFAGVFDGQNYKISNFAGYYTSSTSQKIGQALFGDISGATIKNLDFVNATAQTQGALSFRITGSSSIENVVVHVKTMTGNGNGKYSAFGYNTSGTLTLNNVLVSLPETTSTTVGLLTTHAAKSIVVDNVYVVGGSQALHSTSGNASYLPEYKNSQGAEAKENVDYFMYSAEEFYDSANANNSIIPNFAKKYASTIFDDTVIIGLKATLNRVNAVKGVTPDNETVEFIEFDGFSGNTFFMTQFTGKNAPNYTVRSDKGYAKWNAEHAPIVMIANSWEAGWVSVRVGRGFNSSSSSNSLGNSNVSGLHRLSNTKSYIQIVGYELISGSSSATFSLYLFEISSDNKLTLIDSSVKDFTYMSNALSGSKAVIYGNIGVTPTTTVQGPTSVTFRYTTPSTSLSGVVGNLSDTCVFKSQLKTLLSLA